MVKLWELVPTLLALTSCVAMEMVWPLDSGPVSPLGRSESILSNSQRIQRYVAWLGAVISIDQAIDPTEACHWLRRDAGMTLQRCMVSREPLLAPIPFVVPLS
jgi:hypothetical protein